MHLTVRVKSLVEGKAVLSGIGKNAKIIQNGAYITIGEFISTKSKKRNGKDSEGKLNYDNSISRAMLIDEIRIIFQKQKEFGSKLVSDELLKDYKEIAFTQRALKSVLDMVAKCSFEKNELRASKSSIMVPFFKTSKISFLIPPLYDTSGNSFAPLGSKLLSA